MLNYAAANVKNNSCKIMNEKELRELFCDMQKKGLSPLICDTKVPLYETVVPCGIPTAGYDDCVDSVHSNI